MIYTWSSQFLHFSAWKKDVNQLKKVFSFFSPMSFVSVCYIFTSAAGEEWYAMIIEVPLNINRSWYFSPFAVMAVGASLRLIWGDESSGRCICRIFFRAVAPSPFPRCLAKVLKSEITSTTIVAQRMLFGQESSLKWVLDLGDGI